MALLSNTYGLIALSLMHLGMNIASSMYARNYCGKEIPGLGIRFWKYESEWYGKIFNYGFKTFMMFIGQKIVCYFDSIVIGIVLGPAHVTFFVIGASLTEYMRRIVIQMTQMFTPLTSELQTRGENEKISTDLMQGTKMSLIIALPISIVFLTMGERFISLWMGKEYGPLSGEVLIVLTIAHLFSVGPVHYPGHLAGTQQALRLRDLSLHRGGCKPHPQHRSRPVLGDHRSRHRDGHPTPCNRAFRISLLYFQGCESGYPAVSIPFLSRPDNLLRSWSLA